jgi:hypothetical protein
MSSRYHRFPPRRNEFYASADFHPANVSETFAAARSVRDYDSRLARLDSRVTNGVLRAAHAHAVEITAAKFDLPRPRGYDRRS